MTSDSTVADPARAPGSTRQQAAEAKRRQQVLKFVMLATAARAVVSKRTLGGVIVLGIGLAALKNMGNERGTPALDWYRARGQNKGRSS
jgi:hypothetical protein